LRELENRELWRKYGPKKKWREIGEDCTTRSFITCTLPLKLLE
jgi:hypothetical protein